MGNNPYREFKERHGLRALMEQDGHSFRGNKTMCPFHPDETPSLSIKVGDDGFEFFKCFGCGKGGDVIQYLHFKTGRSRKEIVRGKTENLPRRKVSMDAAPKAPPDKPFAYTEAWSTFTEWRDALLANDAQMAWLAGRGIDRKAVVMNWLGYSTNVEGLNLKKPEPMLTMPNFAPRATPDDPLTFCSVEARFLNHQKGRRWPPKYMTTGTRHLWHLPQLYRDAGGMVILQESCFDAMLINRMMMRHISTAIPANNFKEEHARKLSVFRRVYLIADPGEAGQEHAEKVKGLIRSTEVINLGADLGDVYRDNPDEAYRVVYGLVRKYYDIVDPSPLYERTAS